MRLLGKLGFIHRRLWERDNLYRIAFLAGPAPLIGGGLAAGLWFLIQSTAPPEPAAQWGRPPQAAEYWSATEGPQSLQPSRPIPPAGANGELNGYERGLQGEIHAVAVSPTYNTDIDRSILTRFAIEGLTGDLAQIIPQGPQHTRFVGVGAGFLIIDAAGIYGLTARFERPSGPTADCLIRLYFGPRKIVSNYWMSVPGDSSKTYDPIKFDLKPGLYPIDWVIGCWQGQEMVGPGRVTILVSHPGDDKLVPARSDEIVRTERVK